MDVVINLKGVGGKFNSFSTNLELVPVVEEALVKSSEAVIEKEITPYPFQTETTIAAWHYQAGQSYMSSQDVIQRLIENVCRNGTMLLNVTQHGDGHLDDEAIKMCREVGAWLKVNGEAIYGTRPFAVWGEGDVRYTRANGFVYALALKWPRDNQFNLAELKKGGTTIGTVTSLSLLGTSVPLSFTQNEQGLSIKASQTPIPGHAYVIKIVQDKLWINDDDPGVVYSGWRHVCNLAKGDFNNDLHLSTLAGDLCELDFQGTGVDVLATQGPNYGKMEIFIDGQSEGEVDLGSKGDLQHQKSVYTISGLPANKHLLKIVHLDSSLISVDAFRTYP